MEWVLIGLGFLVFGIFVLAVVLPALGSFLLAVVFVVYYTFWLLTYPIHRGGQKDAD